MRKQSASELGRLASVQSEAMNDICNIYTVTRASGTYGTQSSQTRVLTSSVPCGIWFPQDVVKNLRQGNTQTSPQLLIMDYDCILRLPSNQVLNVTDEVELIEKGETMISGTFRPANPPIVNSSVQHVQLKRVVP